MPPSERAIVDPHIQSEPTATDRNEAAIQLVDAWLREDAPSLGARLLSHLSIESQPDSWEHLKAELDRDRPSDRKLFR